jgi:glycolate oxidase
MSITTSLDGAKRRGILCVLGAAAAFALAAACVKGLHGALPLADAVLLGLGKFKRILDVDYEDRVAVVQPGVTNLAITQAVEGRGFYYAPDPSSQIACSIGGNVAENSGGVHCLKYGLTTNNVLGVEMVMMDGEVVRLGGQHLDPAGLDLLGIVVGSEGLLGVVTEVTVRLLPKPQTARALLLGFETIERAGQCVADVIAAGIIPAGMEMMDRPAIHAAELAQLLNDAFSAVYKHEEWQWKRKHSQKYSIH